MLAILSRWFRPAICRHEFLLSDLDQTGIPPLPKPTTRGYHDWSKWYDEFYKHDSVTKRVQWPCRKCGKVFYARCGLDIAPYHGRIVQGDKP